MTEPLHNHAGELEDLDDIDSEVDDEWAGAINSMTTKQIVVIKGGAGSGNFGHAGRPGKIGGSTTQGRGVTKIVLPKDRPDAIIEGRRMSWNDAMYHAKRTGQRITTEGNYVDMDPDVRETLANWFTFHDNNVALNVGAVRIPVDAETFYMELQFNYDYSRGEAMGIVGLHKRSNGVITLKPKSDSAQGMRLDPSMKDVFHHEVGHAAYNASNNRNAWDLPYQFDTDFDRFTNYSRTNVSEGFAETYMLYTKFSNVDKGKLMPRMAKSFASVEEVIHGVH